MGEMPGALRQAGPRVDPPVKPEGYGVGEALAPSGGRDIQPCLRFPDFVSPDLIRGLLAMPLAAQGETGRPVLPEGYRVGGST